MGGDFGSLRQQTERTLDLKPQQIWFSVMDSFLYLPASMILIKLAIYFDLI